MSGGPVIDIIWVKKSENLFIYTLNQFISEIKTIEKMKHEKAVRTNLTLKYDVIIGSNSVNTFELKLKSLTGVKIVLSIIFKSPFIHLEFLIKSNSGFEPVIISITRKNFTKIVLQTFQAISKKFGEKINYFSLGAKTLKNVPPRGPASFFVFC